MFRKTTAVMFFAVMAMLITLKHPVLGYCLCLDSYFTGDCVCAVEKSTAQATTTDDADCPSCCSPCETTTDQDATTPAPCDDCTQHLLVDVGDFVWHASDEVPSDADSLFIVPSYDLCSEQLPLASLHTAVSARGDPPPGLTDGIPIYLRHRVLRL